jgi:DNA polymerase II large subunit
MKIACGRLGPDEALCLRCHARREMVDAQPFMMKSGRRALRGKCASCGGTVTRIIPSQAG